MIITEVYTSYNVPYYWLTGTPDQMTQSLSLKEPSICMNTPRIAIASPTQNIQQTSMILIRQLLSWKSGSKWLGILRSEDEGVLDGVCWTSLEDGAFPLCIFTSYRIPPLIPPTPPTGMGSLGSWTWICTSSSSWEAWAMAITWCCLFTNSKTIQQQNQARHLPKPWRVENNHANWKVESHRTDTYEISCLKKWEPRSRV